MYDDYLWIEGIPFLCVWFKPEIIREVHDNFVVKDEDIVVCLTPRTNWLVQILCLICTKGDPKWVQSVSVWGTHHGVESGVGFELLKNMEGRRFTATHLPFQLFPKSFLSSKAKVIYLIRNPRNVAVSGYFFWKKLNVCKIAKSWDEYFEWFIQGKGICGDWKNYFMVSQAEAFNKIFQENLKMAGFPPGMFPWEECSQTSRSYVNTDI
uniref:Sulfotransferase n=1 Tax=Castor canadensis TaxID=51338 RepID=A0A8C0W608_CASCN